jgi:hypothetical protein
MSVVNCKKKNSNNQKYYSQKEKALLVCHHTASSAKIRTIFPCLTVVLENSGKYKKGQIKIKYQMLLLFQML